MSPRTDFPPTRRSADSVKTRIAITIIVIVFCILHITAGMLLRNASATSSNEPSKLVTYGD
jgi:hypothetical protein